MTETWVPHDVRDQVVDFVRTLDIYTHAINRDKLVAQNQVMEAMMKPGLVN